MKMQLYFSSGNSSFTECVKKRSLYTLSFSLNSESYNSTPYNGCVYNSSNPTPFLESNFASFFSCQFTSLTSGENGGAILCTQSGASLNIFHSYFEKCAASGGGAIHVSSLKSLTVLSASFFSCHSTCTLQDVLGGGGIEICSVDIPLINDCSFVQCSAKDDGAGIRVDGCGQLSYHSADSSPLVKDHLIIQNSLFVDCNCAGGATPSGAGIIFWYDKETLGCSDCLFSRLHTEHTGGAIHANYNNHVAGSHPLHFCFFNRNNCDQNNGHDFCVYCALAGNVFLQCFSTSGEKRVCTCENGYQQGLHDDWLPSGQSVL